MDGVLVGTGATTGTPSNLHDGEIGSIQTVTYAMNGYMDDIRLYRRALSASEVKAVYDATK